MSLRRFLLLAAILGWFGHDGARAQTKLSLTQLPNCVTPATTAANSPIILALVPFNGTAVFSCYILSGVTIQPGTASTPPTIIIPAAVVPAFITGEIPKGTIDGSNAVFTTASTPSGGSIEVFRNGVLQLAGTDYTLAAASITFSAGSIPQPGDTVQCNYRH